ncbi:MAG: hypothetical protein ROO76_08590 [Terriglobia bacterium]|nr:hypothetical protein [Terriglobia bacterium]
MDRLKEKKEQLLELAEVLNKFASEAVQLRVLELVFAEENTSHEEPRRGSLSVTKRPHRIVRRKQESQPDTEGKKWTEKKKRGTGSGAPATLTQLVEGTFFDSPRTINDIIEYSKHNLARTFKANEFSGKLARLVRNGALTREKNAENQYEYKKT